MRGGWLRSGGTVAAIGLVLAFAAPVARADDQPGPNPQTASDEEIIDYYDSGRWKRAVRSLVDEAEEYLRAHAGDDSKRKPALVLDIDDTSLRTYDCQKDKGAFGSTQLSQCVAEAGADTQAGGDGLPRIKATRRLFRLAHKLKVKVFFVTGRPEFTREPTLQNLDAQDFDEPFKLIMQPDDEWLDHLINGGSLVPYKSRSREEIEDDGFRILVNVGDQHSDLKGGHAQTTFLLPNPMYFTE